MGRCESALFIVILVHPPEQLTDEGYLPVRQDEGFPSPLSACVNAHIFDELYVFSGNFGLKPEVKGVILLLALQIGEEPIISQLDVLARHNVAIDNAVNVVVHPV